MEQQNSKAATGITILVIDPIWALSKMNNTYILDKKKLSEPDDKQRYCGEPSILSELCIENRVPNSNLNQIFSP